MCDLLVLEDDDLVRELLAEMLEMEGFEVTACATPQEALGQIHAAPPYLMLATDIDLGLGQLDGFAVAQELRTARTNLPVLYVTGQPARLNEHRLDAFEACLLKPFSLEAFADKLRGLGVAPIPRTTLR